MKFRTANSFVSSFQGLNLVLILCCMPFIGLDILLKYEQSRQAAQKSCLVAIAEGFHTYPSRTRPLSPPAPMVLGPQGPGRVGRRQAQEPLLILINGGFFMAPCKNEIVTKKRM